MAAQPTRGHSAGSTGNGEHVREKFAAARRQPAHVTDFASGQGVLPRSLTSFIGRRRELVEIRALLEVEPLVTLVGPGGVGKTRLAIELAGGMHAAYPDGVRLVELAPLVDSTLVVGAVAAAVGVREQRDIPLRRTLADALRRRRLLLILDNCEHLAQACAAIGDLLLRQCFELHILATSRAPLEIAGEVVWPVAPLPQPDGAAPTPQEVVRSDAGHLFVERARSAQPDFDLDARTAPLVADICRRLDGIPLALELAATRVRVLGVPGLAARLDDRFRLLVGGRTAPARQQTLRATLNWSYDLLGEPERRLLARLAPFAGGCTLEDIDAVCQDEALPREHIAERLGVLVDQSWVVVDQRSRQVRYRLLETMRQYAAERLVDFDEEQTAYRRHRDHYLRLAERVPCERFDGQHLDWLAEEVDNIRSALRWSIDHGEIESGLRLANAQHGLWYLRGPCSEGRAWFDELLDHPQAAAETVLAARSLGAAGRLAVVQGDLSAATRLLQRSRAVAERVGDLHGLALVGLRHGTLLRAEGDLQRARSVQAEALDRSRTLADADLEVLNLYALSTTLLEMGARDEAEALAQDCLAISERTGHVWGLASAHRLLGRLCALRGAHARARAHLEESLALSRALGHVQGTLNTLTALGLGALQEADETAARPLLWEALELARELGDQLETVRCLEAFGQIDGRTRPSFAARLAGAAAALRSRVGAEPYPREQAALTDWMDQARQCLGESAFADGWAVGQRLAVEDLIAELRSHERVSEPASVSDEPARNGLTQREREIAALVGSGMSTRAIAAQLVITDGTAKVHIARILSKLDLHSRAQLAVWAVQHQLVPSNT